MPNEPANQPRPVPREELAGDAIQPGDPLFGTVWINKQRMSGSPCFYGTRVPLKNLFDDLRAGRSIDEFLADFPGVTRPQVGKVLHKATHRGQVWGPTCATRAAMNLAIDGGVKICARPRRLASEVVDTC